MRAYSASRNRRSKEALWATRLASPAKAAKRSMTTSQGSAPSSIALLIPVYSSMNGETGTPGFMRDWKRPTGTPPSMRTAPISIERSPWAGESPVVSKSKMMQVLASSVAVMATP